MVHQHADSRAARSGLLQAFDLAHSNAGREFFALGDSAFGARCTQLYCALSRRLRDIQKTFAHAAHADVPPTVILSIFTVGMPTPTGTLCPSLPQTPMPSSSWRSLPTMLTYFSASGPLPISVAPFTGRVILPSSIR